MLEHEKKCSFGVILSTLIFGQLAVDQGHFGQFDQKGTLSALMPKLVVACQSRCSHGPMVKS